MQGITIGVLADIQYRSDRDDYVIDSSGQVRSFRAALGKTEAAITAFSAPYRDLTAIVHLGDIIDGRGEEFDRDLAMPDVEAELDAVLDELAKRPRDVPMYHVLGNHCLYIGRGEIVHRLGLKDSTYYAKDLSPDWRLIVLDTMDVGVHRPPGSGLRALADQYLASQPAEPNAVAWNGGPSADQLQWLRQTLKQASADQVNVLVCGHHPLLAAASAPQYISWFSQSILDIFRVSGITVRAYFAGHFHPGGYARADGVHHITFPSILDSDATNSYSFVHLHSDRISVQGCGLRGPSTRSYEF